MFALQLLILFEHHKYYKRILIRLLLHLLLSFFGFPACTKRGYNTVQWIIFWRILCYKTTWPISFLVVRFWANAIVIPKSASRAPKWPLEPLYVSLVYCYWVWGILLFIKKIFKLDVLKKKFRKFDQNFRFFPIL